MPVQVKEFKGSVLIEPAGLLDDNLQVDESLVEVDENGLTTVLITDTGKSLCHLKSDAQLAHANKVESELLSVTGQVPESTPSDENSTRPPEISRGQLLVKDELTHPLQDNTSEPEMLPAEFSEQCKVLGCM